MVILIEIKKNISKSEIKNYKKEIFDCDLNDDDSDSDSEENEKKNEGKKKSFSPNSNKNTQNKLGEITKNNKNNNNQFSLEKNSQISKKTLFENISNSHLNFKQFLEIKFFINNHDIPKNVTIYEILQKFKKISFFHVKFSFYTEKFYSYFL